MKKRIIALLVALILLAGVVPAALADLPCGACQGNGWVRCGNCVSGWVLRGVARTGYVRSLCSSCGGSGRVSCRACGGDGRIGSSDPGTSSGGGSSTHTADINKTELTLLSGSKERLKVNWASGTVKWSSSNTSVARVSSKGMVTAKKAGTCTITAKTGSQKLKCKVTVRKKVYAKSIKLSKSKATMLVAGTLDLSFKLSPGESKITQDWQVVWKSSDPNVASVEEGHVVGRNPGTATITAKLKVRHGDGMKLQDTAKCTIKVESGLTRFKRWFNKSSFKDGKNKVVYTGDTDKIVYNPSDKTWTFYRYEDNYNGYDEVWIRFNSDFTGNAEAYYYWYRSGAYTGVDETECTATQSTRSLSLNTTYDWDFSKGGSYGERDVADANIASLLSGMHVFLRDAAGLNAKVGWKDLGLKAY